VVKEVSKNVRGGRATKTGFFFLFLIGKVLSKIFKHLLDFKKLHEGLNKVSTLKAQSLTTIFLPPPRPRFFPFCKNPGIRNKKPPKKKTGGGLQSKKKIFGLLGNYFVKAIKRYCKGGGSSFFYTFWGFFEIFFKKKTRVRAISL